MPPDLAPPVPRNVVKHDTDGDSGLIVALIATAGRPEKALGDGRIHFAINEPPLELVAVAHDWECCCLNGRPLRECSCELLRLLGKPMEEDQ
jgi:hypothetical protein